MLLAYSIKYRYRIIIIIAAIAAVSFATGKIWPKLAQSNSLSIGYVGSYSIKTIPAQILSLATQSLISKDESGKPLGQLASHWTVTEDGKTYIVFLKDNLKWHDSTSVEAKDISIAISGVRITALNNKAIEFKLENPISSFLVALDKPVFKLNSFYGMGTYRITDIDEVNNIVRKISLVSKEKSLPEVNIKFYPTEAQAVNALKIGAVKSINIAHPKELTNWKTLNIDRQFDAFEIITIFLNTEDNLLSSKELRQALYYAINKTDFDGPLSNSPISQKSWAYDPDARRYEYNPGRAKELLAKSEIKNPKIVLSVTGDLKDIAETIKRDWQSMGIETEIKVEKTIPATFQALLAVNKLNADPDQYAMWHSTQASTNITRYKNVKIDKLLEDARSESKEEIRKQLYSDFQKNIMDDVPAIFLYHPYKYQLTYKNIENQIKKLPK